jgi:malate dehydrogenase (oxaloacetate-decarboxylating)(NADP+)
MIASQNTAIGNVAPAVFNVLAASLSSAVAHVPTAAYGSVLVDAAVAGSSRRSISSGNDFEVDDKLGRPTTPWVRQVISGVDLMRHPKYNKGLAFSESERDRLYLRGLLPPAVLSQEVQLERAILNIRSKADPLDKHAYLSSLQGRNERLFYRCGGGSQGGNCLQQNPNACALSS